jgi:hypothetical protein
MDLEHWGKFLAVVGMIIGLAFVFAMIHLFVLGRG